MKKYFTIDYIFTYVSCIAFFLFCYFSYYRNTFLYCNIVLAILVIFTSGSYKDNKDDNYTFWQPFSVFFSTQIAIIGSSVFLIFLQLFKASSSIFYFIICCLLLFIVFELTTKQIFQLANSVMKKNAIRLCYKYTSIILIFVYGILNIIGIIVLWINGAFIYSILDEITIFVCYSVCNFFIIDWIKKLGNIKIGLESTRGNILFLRPFKLDSYFEDNLIENIKHQFPGKSIVRIGDPNYLSHGHTYIKSIFLTDNNWKDAVHKYATDADMILIAIDSPYGYKIQGYRSFKDITGNIVTEGVLWEILEHREFQNKTIYHIAFLPSFPVDIINRDFFFDAINTIKKQIEAKSLFVCVKNHEFYVTESPVLIKALMDHRNNSEYGDVPDDVIVLIHLFDSSNSESIQCSWLTINSSNHTVELPHLDSDLGNEREYDSEHEKRQL